MSTPDLTAIKRYLWNLQDVICHQFMLEDGQGEFIEDLWDRAEGGGGCTRILVGGAVIEKAGVNFSHVHGKSLPDSATARHPNLKNCSFQALGLSVVIHPLNPYVPTAHFNIRFFIAEPKNSDPIWWFGGGFDLTPYYGFVEDAIHWHQVAYQACQLLGEETYSRYKKHCDEYFYIKHRNEPRGIGGIFFDDLSEGGFDRCFEFMRSVGDHFMLAYQPIMARRKQLLYGEREKDFQRYRRGRYAEFNLIYDRGTLFGLQSGGRTESILMSLPPEVVWRYNWHPEAGSAEAELYNVFLKPRDWLAKGEDSTRVRN